MRYLERLKEQYRINKRKLLYSYKNGYIGKNVYEVVLNNGCKKIIEQILKNNTNGDAVVIIPITENNNFIIIIESRPNTIEGVSVEFPAGMVDKNETFEHAALRELEEETGYISNKLVELEWHYQDQGCSKAIIKTFVAIDCIKVKQQKLDSGENITLVEIDKADLDVLYDENELLDANSKIAYLTYRLKNDKRRSK